jgi:hypothetical protein
MSKTVTELFSCQVVFAGKKRVAIEHPGTGIFHYRPDHFPHIGLIAMDRAFRAAGLVFPQGAFSQALCNIVKKSSAFRTKTFSLAMMSGTEDSNHQSGRL